MQHQLVYTEKAKTQAIKQVANLPETKEFTNQLLPEIPSETNLQLKADMQDRIKTVTPDTDIPEQARVQMKKLLETKYVSIISQFTTDIGSTDLIELNIPMEALPIASKPYSVPLKYREFMD